MNTSTDPAESGVRAFFDDLGERLRVGWPLAIRMIVSASVAYLISKALHLPEATWSVLTALVAARSHAVGTARAGADRAIGTIGGALIAVAVALLHGHLNQGVLLLTVLAPACLLVAVDEKFRAAPVAGLIVISGGVIAGSALTTAFYRTTEILIGGLTAYVASLLIAPSHGDDKVEYRAVVVLRLLRRQAEMTLRSREVGGGDELRDRLREALRGVGVAAHSSRWSKRSEATDATKLTRLLSALHADLNFIDRARAVPPVKEDDIVHRELVSEIGLAIEQTLEAIVANLRTAQPLPELAVVDAPLGRFEQVAPGQLCFLLKMLRNDIAKTLGLLARQRA